LAGCLAVAAIYGVMGLVAFAACGIDKRRAENGQWRISEAQLHLIDLVGGTIGGLIGQQHFRHKTFKPGYVRITFAIAGLHALGLAGIAIGLLDARLLSNWLASLS
jgi:uncharacterized membrane protein YsdA (DUF1294 family)